MASTVKLLDPVQGLIDYVNDIKPYHTKIIETLVEYVGTDNVEITINEDFAFLIDLDFKLKSLIACPNGGYGSLFYDNPTSIPIISPDLSKSLVDYGSITTDSFIVANDQRDKFDPVNGLSYIVRSFIDDRIIGVAKATGSPLQSTLAEFYVVGDRTADYVQGTVFSVVGSTDNNTNYQVSNPPTYILSSNITVIPVYNQTIQSNTPDGFIRRIDVNNSGTFNVVSSIYSNSTTTLIGNTKVFITGMVFTPPNPVDYNYERNYVSVVNINALEYVKIYSYSNILRYYNSIMPESILHTPDEGILLSKIVGVVGSPLDTFTIAGNLDKTNLFVGDEFTVIDSSGNNGDYTILDISYNVTYNTTEIRVATIPNPSPDGYVKMEIPSNVFVVDGNYTAFFRQGVNIDSFTGSETGKYRVINSRFINNQTYIRVLEDLVDGVDGRRIELVGNGSPGQYFIVNGDYTTQIATNDNFNVTKSVLNNGFYTVSAVSFSPSLNQTTIYVDESVDDTDNTGEIHKFTKGLIKYSFVGYGQTPQLCGVMPDTLVKVSIHESLEISNINVVTSEDILVYDIGSQSGYEFPAYTAFSDNTPTVSIQNSPPTSPIEGDFWFDTSNNILSLPGELKSYEIINGVPTWSVIETNKAYWVDTDDEKVYYRLIYQYYDEDSATYPIPSIGNNLDTGWVLLYGRIPGYSDVISKAESARVYVDTESFFVYNKADGSVENEFALVNNTIPSIGSPASYNNDYIDVFVNGVGADITILTDTTFTVNHPLLHVDDLVEAIIYVPNQYPSNAFIGAYDATASITETFDMVNGYDFNIYGTESSSSSIYLHDDAAGSVQNIFKPSGILADTVVTITNSDDNSNNKTYTLLDSVSIGSPIEFVKLTVLESINDTGSFANSPIIDAGNLGFMQWFQYMIVNTTSNTIVVFGDATDDIYLGSPMQLIKITHSASNNGVYTINSVPTYNGTVTTISVVETIPVTGPSGGWLESNN